MVVDFVANAQSLGAYAVRAKTRDELRQALSEARERRQTTVVVIETSYDQRVPGYESWWDVPIAEVSEVETVQAARAKYMNAREKQRIF